MRLKGSLKPIDTFSIESVSINRTWDNLTPLGHQRNMTSVTTEVTVRFGNNQTIRIHQFDGALSEEEAEDAITKLYKGDGIDRAIKRLKK